MRNQAPPRSEDIAPSGDGVAVKSGCLRNPDATNPTSTPLKECSFARTAPKKIEKMLGVYENVLGNFFIILRIPGTGMMRTRDSA